MKDPVKAVTAVIETVIGEMAECGASIQDVASYMGARKDRVSALLNGSSSITVGELIAITAAVGLDLEISVGPIDRGEEHEEG